MIYGRTFLKIRADFNDMTADAGCQRYLIFGFDFALGFDIYGATGLLATITWTNTNAPTITRIGAIILTALLIGFPMGLFYCFNRGIENGGMIWWLNI